MNHILIKFLISLLLFNFIHSSDDFENWLKDNERKIFHKTGVSKISFNMKMSVLGQPNIKESDSCYILLDIPNNTFQIKLFDNIIYHDKVKSDQYNLLSNQLFRYNKDKIISGLINNILSKDYFFNFSKYEYDNLLGKYVLSFNNNSLNLSLIDGSISINYQNNIYTIEIADLEIQSLNKNQYNSLLLYNIIDTTKSEIFDFRN